MNAETFEQWLQDVLLIKLQQPSVIVLDNASYHSRLEEKRPTSAWRKAVGPVYAVDQIIHAAGHDVIRLPPYYCIFNPIEMVWSQAKRKYDEVVLQNHNPLEAWALALAAITPQQWTNYVEHTERLIFKYWTKEKFVTVNEIIINLNLDSDDSDDDFSHFEDE
ncbi:uncharacterized protein [Tenebrio molitor]|uniref:uncharacterized protein n=1 Tax=Tenebrio molitor TaxID=7067 RepID=UPI003624A6E8